MSDYSHMPATVSEATETPVFRCREVAEFCAEFDRRRRIMFSQLNCECKVLVERIPIEIPDDASETTEIGENEDSPVSVTTVIDEQFESNEFDELIVTPNVKRRRELSTSDSDDDLEISVSDDSTSETDSSSKANERKKIKKKKTPIKRQEECPVKTKKTNRANAKLRKLLRSTPHSLPLLSLLPLSDAIIDMATDGDATKAAAIVEEIEKCNKSVPKLERRKPIFQIDLSSDDDFDEVNRSFRFDKNNADLENSDDSDIAINYEKEKKEAKEKKRKKSADISRSRKQAKTLSSSSDSSESDSYDGSDSDTPLSDESDTEEEVVDDEKENRTDVQNKKQSKRKIGQTTIFRKKKLMESQKKFNSLFKKPCNRKGKTKPMNGESKSSSSAEDECEIIGELDKSSTTPEESTSSGRRNIRRILTEKELREATKKAQQEEKLRLQRIAEKGNEIALVNSELGSTGRLVLEFDKEKRPLVEVEQKIALHLKKHQIEGVKFLWNCLIESVEVLKNSEGSGCILAHSMGLGKTLQVIAFIHTLLSNERTNDVIKTCIVVCPKNTARNWANEFKIWLTFKDLKSVNVFEMEDCRTPSERIHKLETWHRRKGVLIIGMPMFTKLIIGGKKISENQLKTFHLYLANPGADVVICDEGHKLKNSKAQLNEACSQVKTKRRAILTGTPLQNCLQEYQVMMNFVKPDLLGSEKEFTNRFVNPITNGQHSDSTLYDVKLMKKRVHVLHKLLDGCVQRYDYRELVPYLQPKFEYTIYVQLSELQIKLYQHYLDNFSRRDRKCLFKDHQVLMCIWNHPCLLFALKHLKREEKRKPVELLALESDSEVDDEVANNGNNEQPSTSTQSTEKTNEKEGDPKDITTEWFKDFVSASDSTKVELSGKMVVLCSIIRECELVGEKLVVFSQSCLFLDLLEDCLRVEDSGTCKWMKGNDYLRIDGKVDSDLRKKYIDKFNNPQNSRCRLFLVATRSGSLGINLYGANRCVIFDACWNPTHDSQAVCRLYRLGQKKTVFVYRLIAQGTMEEKIYEKQIIKQSLACRVVDEQQIERHFTHKEIAEMYKFFPDTNTERPTPVLPKDNILADLLKKHHQEIVNYCQHDSLLENKPEEDLTEEERLSAWNEWEEEKDDELRKQKEEELRKQKEEELRKQKEEELRKQKEEELRQQKEEELRKQKEEELKKQQELQRMTSVLKAHLLGEQLRQQQQQQQQQKQQKQQQQQQQKQQKQQQQQQQKQQQNHNQNGTTQQQAKPQQSFQHTARPAQQNYSRQQTHLQNQSRRLNQNIYNSSGNIPHSQPPNAHQSSGPQPTFRPQFQPNFQSQFRQTQNVQPPTAQQTSHQRRPPAATNVAFHPTTPRQQANQPSASTQQLNNGHQASVGLPSYDKLTLENVMTYLGIPILSDDRTIRDVQLKDMANVLSRGIVTVRNSLNTNRHNPSEYQRNCAEMNNLNRQVLRLKQVVAAINIQNNTANGIIIEETDAIPERLGARRKTAAVLIEELD